MKQLLLNDKAFTLVEILIGTLLLGMVFAGSISMYLSSLKFLGNAQAVDVTTIPVVSLENVTKAISLAYFANVTGGGRQLDLSEDYNTSPNCNDFSSATANVTPSVVIDDKFWHYRFINSALRVVCDGVPGTNVNGADPVMIPNVDTTGGGSSFQIINPSAQGTNTVVQIHLVTTSPAGTLDTNVGVGAMPKN